MDEFVVDDDREIVNAIAIVLEREGYAIRKAYDGMEALEQAMSPDVRLILIDVMMPKLDGLSALMRIREKRNLPVLVLSAKSEDSDKILGLSMGAGDYVTKPYNPQELVARVRSQLRRYTMLGMSTRSGGAARSSTASLRNTSKNELPEGVDFTARFVRGDESRTDGGTGLGLSVAKSFTEACNGSFRVEMVADLFTAIVSFPLAAQEREA